MPKLLLYVSKINLGKLFSSNNLNPVNDNSQKSFPEDLKAPQKVLF